MEINHCNRWLTDSIQSYFKGFEGELKLLIEPYKTFSKMDKLFGLGTNYICGQRKEKNSKKIIAVNILNRMRSTFKNYIQKWIRTYPHFSNLLLKTQEDILRFIDEYENKLGPKPSTHYQMYNFHPKFIRDYFQVIDTKEKAYWLGFLFADGWIYRELKDSGYYYRMGIGLSTKDKGILIKFSKAKDLILSIYKIDYQRVILAIINILLV